MGVFVITSKEQSEIELIINKALLEDLGIHGDITSKAIFSPTDTAKAIIKSKASGVLSGAYLLNDIFRAINRDLQITIELNDSEKLEHGTIICKLEGPVQAILAGERIALNFLQRLSGIATMTSKLVNAIAHTNTKLLDTRKTIPTLRLLEKKAVVHGGGYNHRFGLFDMMLIKDTHVKRAGGVVPALEKAIAYRSMISTPYKIEIEVQSIAEFESILSLNPDRIMLDNMTRDQMSYCVEIRQKNAPNIELEASGNITLSTIVPIAETGVDYISSGAITHSSPALDIHLVIID